MNILVKFWTSIHFCYCSFLVQEQCLLFIFFIHDWILCLFLITLKGGYRNLVLGHPLLSVFFCCSQKNTVLNQNFVLDHICIIFKILSRTRRVSSIINFSPTFQGGWNITFQFWWIVRSWTYVLQWRISHINKFWSLSHNSPWSCFLLWLFEPSLWPSLWQWIRVCTNARSIVFLNKTSYIIILVRYLWALPMEYAGIF